MGVGRSCCLVLAHLLAGRFRGAGPQEALDFLSARRPLANPNSRQIEAAVEAAASYPD
jgi:protein-tyrosine phosphatase